MTPRLRSAALAAALALASAATPAQTEKVLRVAPHANLGVLDPVWTTQAMARNHGYMIYDTLFGTDERNQIKPQMVDQWSVSTDKRVWTFALREGLLFHDGAPVTGEDVVASLARWGKHDVMGRKLMSFVERMESPDARTFRLVLREPCGFVLEALGKPSSNVPFIMPKRIAATPIERQIEEHIGSGPYVFSKENFKSGERAVYLKNPKYTPRKDPPSGTAGGKRVYVDRVEWNLALRDPQSQVGALMKGEIDIVEQPAFESYAQLRQARDVEIVNSNPLGFQFMLRFNHLHPPFDNPKIRQAALAALAQEPFLRAQVGIRDYTRTCASMFICGTPYASTKGGDVQARANPKKVQELLKAAGYDGRPVVILKPTDLAAIAKLPDVAAQLLRQAGFNVELQTMEWHTLVSRRARKDPPSRDGWNLFLTAWAAPEVWNPLANAAVNAAGGEAWFGWPNDEALEKLRAQFAAETDSAKRKGLAEAIQVRAFEIGTHVPLGEYVNPAAVRRSIRGLVTGPGNFYWNIRKI